MRIAGFGRLRGLSSDLCFSWRTRSGSGRQGRNPAGESPAVPIARFRHVAMPHLGMGNHPGDAWCKRLGCPEHICVCLAVGATGKSSKYGSLNTME